MTPLPLGLPPEPPPPGTPPLGPPLAASPPSDPPPVGAPSEAPPLGPSLAAVPPESAADPALRGSFLGLLRALAAARALDPEDLEQQVWLRAAAERRASRPVARLRALTVQEFRRALAEAAEQARSRESAARLAARTGPEDASPEYRTLAAERARELRAAVARLPARCPALVAALLESPAPGYRELAERLSLPLGSVGPTRARCLACLRRMLPPAQWQPGRQGWDRGWDQG